MTEIYFLDAVSLAEKIKQKEITSVELLEIFSARWQKHHQKINAIVVSNIEEARARAVEADVALESGENWGPLHGVPMTIKESFDYAGLPSTFGIPTLKDNIAQNNAVIVQRLLNAGAIIFGKTNVPIHLADFQSYNDIYGTTNNPWDVERTPGGSSGGSAAALAAGLTGLDLGTDIGGSIRNPANYCGVFGHKPTWGIVPMRGHAMPDVLTPSDISVPGPLARSARDLRLSMEIIAGSDELHGPGWQLNLQEPSAKNVKQLRVAVWSDDEFSPVDAQVKERVEQSAQWLEEQGAQVDYGPKIPVTPQDSHDLYFKLLHSAMSARQADDVFEKNLQVLEGLSEDDKSERAKIVRAATLPYRSWHALNEQRTHLRWAWLEFFKDYDVLISPICASSAFPHDHNPRLGQRTVEVNGEQVPYFQQLFWAGFTGVAYLPSTVIPTGPDKSGLPIGIQITGAEMADYTTIRVAEWLSEFTGGFRAPMGY